MQKVLRLSRTVAHLSAGQIGQKVNYRFKKYCFEKNIFGRVPSHALEVFPIDLIPCFTSNSSISGTTVTLLNKKQNFTDGIDWNFTEHGQLWNILLNSFEYLNTESISQADGVDALLSFIKSSRRNKTLCDSHCISQRILNIIRFCSRFKIDDPSISKLLYTQAYFLKQNPEFHLRNNHLLDNGFALLFASVFFNEPSFFRVAEKILFTNISKQVLPDGAHFELSPMYHLLMIHRMLNTLHALNSCQFDAHRLKGLIKKQVPRMLGWIRNIQFKNGCLPAFNDSAEGYGTTLTEVFKLASALHVDCSPVTLRESGFRKFRNRNFEMVIDVNGLTPAEAPGHSHADTFHFILHVFGEPFIIDTGVSTYVPGSTRSYERSTRAHNTVVINDCDQSELYDSFRVGRRARVTKISEAPGMVEASHNGYRLLGATHSRRFVFTPGEISISDNVNSKTTVDCKAIFHIDKKSGAKKKGNSIISRFTTMNFENAAAVDLTTGYFAPSFGVQLPCYMVTVTFPKTLITTIRLNK